MRITKKITSIVLAVLMVVSMMSVMAVSASATDYANSTVSLNALAKGDTLSANDGVLYLEGYQVYSVIIKGGTYREKSGSEAQANDIQFQEGQLQMMVIPHDGYGPVLLLKTGSDKLDYYPLDAEGNISDKWYVLSNENNTLTLAGYVPAAPVDYYVVGTMNDWEISDAYKLDKNPETAGEYMFTDLTVSANTELKVKDSNGAFYPDGMDNNFTLNAAGTYDLYFRPDGQGNQSDGWWYGNIYANNFRAPETFVAQISDAIYTSLDSAIEAVSAGETIQLLENVTLTESLVIPEGKNFTLDLNGKDITGNVNDKLVKNNGTVVVDDSTAAPGHIYNTNIDKQGNAAFVNYGTATIKNGYFGDKNSDQTDANDVNRGAGFQNQGTAVIDGGYFTACDNFTNTEGTGNGYAYAIINYGDITINDATVYGKNNGNLANDEGTMVVNGGTYTLNKPTKKNVYYSIYNGSADANTTVNAGTFTNNGTKALLYTGEGSTEIKGGTFTGSKIEQSAGAPAISGGTFDKVIPENYCADGYTPVANGGGTYTVGGPYAAIIGDTGYATLEAAFAAAEDGDTIKVLADSTGNGIKAPQGKFATGLTVDFNGHTYTVDGETVGSTGTETNGFQLLKNNKVTFTNGTITSAKAKILVQNYSDLELEGMTLTLNNPNYTSAYTLSNNNGEVTINATTINANPAGGFAFDVCRFSTYPSVSVNVIGGSVINGDVEVYASNSDPKNGFQLFLTSGTLNGDIVLDQTAKNVLDDADPAKVAIVKLDTFAQDAPEGYMWVDTATEGIQIIAKAVAQIGTTKYATLEAAFAAAQDGETITVLADCSGNGIKAPQGKFATGLTVDFDGHTYTVIANTVGSTGTETQAFQLLKDNKITFQNGTITSSVAKMLVQNYSNLTLDNMVLNGRNLVGSGRYTLSNNNGNVVINDTTIYAKGGKGSGNYAFDVCRYSSYPSVNVTVTGGSEINGDVEISASKGDAKDGFSLTLAGGTMDGNIIVDASAKSLVGEDNKVTKTAAFTQTAPEGFKWEDNGNNTSKLVAKTLQDDVDANFSVEDIADVHFVDGAGQSVEIVSKAQILGVQLRRPAHDGVYTDGAANGIRFITAVDKEFLNEHPEIVNYGYNVTIKGVTRFFSVKGTTNNVIETDDNDYNYYTFAITNIPEDNSDEIKVQFVFTTDGSTIAAKAAYKNAAGAVSHELVTNYADVKNY